MSADLCFYLGLHGGGRILQHPAPVVSSSVCFLSLLFRMQPAVPAASWGRGPGDGWLARFLPDCGGEKLSHSFVSGFSAARVAHCTHPSPPFLLGSSPLSFFCFSAVPSFRRCRPRAAMLCPPDSLFSCPSPTFSLDLALTITYSGTFSLTF